MSMVQKMFQSTTSAVNKVIRQNKAKIKYNTLVYLIDPDQLRNNQKNYQKTQYENITRYSIPVVDRAKPRRSGKGRNLSERTARHHQDRKSTRLNSSH